MICYVFIFTDEDGVQIEQDIWAWHETEAWHKADDVAFRDGYIDYKLKED